MQLATSFTLSSFNGIKCELTTDILWICKTQVGIIEVLETYRGIWIFFLRGVYTAFSMTHATARSTPLEIHEL